MSETITSGTPSKVKKAKTGSVAKKAKAAATHPPVSEMVLAAVRDLKERNGSSSQAIKKYIGVNYKADVDRLQPFIKKYLKSAVTSGALTQTKGKGANGSFKLSANPTKDKKPKTTVTKDKTKTVAKTTPKKVVKKAANPPKGKEVKKSVKKSETKPKTKSPKVNKRVEKKSKTPKTAKSPKKLKTVKPKPAKKTPKRAPQKSGRKA